LEGDGCVGDGHGVVALRLAVEDFGGGVGPGDSEGDGLGGVGVVVGDEDDILVAAGVFGDADDELAGDGLDPEVGGEGVVFQGRGVDGLFIGAGNRAGGTVVAGSRMFVSAILGVRVAARLARSRLRARSICWVSRPTGDSLTTGTGWSNAKPRARLPKPAKLRCTTKQTAS
jgi:hypothetical protein